MNQWDIYKDVTVDVDLVEKETWGLVPCDSVLNYVFMYIFV